MELRTPDKIAEPTSGSGDVPVASHPHVDPPPAARKSSFSPATIETPNEATVLSDAELEASELETTREQLRRQSSEVVRLRALVDAERARYRALFELAP